ncbi:Retrovirus-related Pol polyprotein from transposon 17.6, partial [Mucuna pruriens]
MIFPANFYVLDMEDETSRKGSALILGSPFLMIVKTKIDVYARTLSMEFKDNLHPTKDHSLFSIDIIDKLYAYLDNNQQLPVIIANNLHREQEEKLLQVLRHHKKAIGWKLSDLLGISPSIYMHKILLEEEARPIRFRTAGESALITRSLIKRLTRITFLFPSSIKYMQIHIAPENQHKTTFTFPFGTFTYTRVSFGLCNTPYTFQRCMINIFSYLLEECMEVFMDNFTFYAESSDTCLENLSPVLTRSIETNLFMVTEGIVLGHLVLSRGIEVDKAKNRLAFVQAATKEVNFVFDKAYEDAFHELKTRLTSIPILQAPNWEYHSS